MINLKWDKLEDNAIDQEAPRLLSQQAVHCDEPEKATSDARAAKHMTRLVSLCILFVCSSPAILSILVSEENPISVVKSKSLHRKFFGGRSSLAAVSDSRTEGHPQLSCLADVHEALNAAGAALEETYSNVSELIIESNITKFIETFRNEEYDAWGKSYSEVKAGMRDWKIKHYANNLKDGDNIFESAMGIGLNTFLTLEAIQEVRALKNLKIYGNEYIAQSVYLANRLLPALLPQVNASTGTICQGDSSDLRSFVPAESMDIVFCGYISTLVNPLNFELDGQDQIDAAYDYICNSTEKDWEAKKLAEVAQERQNAWFGNWVTEMIQIAKPGCPIIVEQVSQPLCNDLDDWGGVSRDFWASGVESYGWDVDPHSIEMETDKVFGERYHVFMRKNVR